MKKILLLGIFLLSSVMAFSKSYLEDYVFFQPTGTSYYLQGDDYNKLIESLKNPKPSSKDFRDIHKENLTLVYSDIEDFYIGAYIGLGEVDGITPLFKRSSDNGDFLDKTLTKYDERGNEIGSLTNDGSPIASSNEYVEMAKVAFADDYLGDDEFYYGIRIGNEFKRGTIFETEEGLFVGFDANGDGKYNAVVMVGPNKKPDPIINSTPYFAYVPNPEEDSELAIAYNSHITCNMFNYDSEYVPYVKLLDSNGDPIKPKDSKDVYGDGYVKMSLSKEDNTYFIDRDILYDPENTAWGAEFLWAPKDEEDPNTFLIDNKQSLYSQFTNLNLNISSYANINPNRFEVSPTETDFNVPEIIRYLTDNYQDNRIYSAVTSTIVVANGTQEGYATNNDIAIENVSISGKPLGVDSKITYNYTVRDVIAIAIPDGRPIEYDPNDPDFGKALSIKPQNVESNSVSATFFTKPLVPTANSDVRTMIIESNATDAKSAGVIAYVANIEASIDVVEGLGQPDAILYTRDVYGDYKEIGNAFTYEDGGQYIFSHNLMYNGINGTNVYVQFVYDDGTKSDYTEVSLPAQTLIIEGEVKAAGNEANYSDEFQGGVMAKGENEYKFDHLIWNFTDDGGNNVNKALVNNNYIISNLTTGEQSNGSFSSIDTAISDDESFDLKNFKFNSSEISWDARFDITCTSTFAVYAPLSPIDADEASKNLDDGYEDIQIVNAFAFRPDYAYFVSDYLTGVEGVSNNGAAVSAHNGNIYVNGAENVVIYNANGSVVYSGNDNVIPMNAGLYIVKANNATYKVIVK